MAEENLALASWTSTGEGRIAGTKQIRVLHIITGLTYGGAERLLLNVCNHMHSRVEIHVIYLKDEPLLGPSFHPSVQIRHIPMGGALSISKLRKAIKSIAPDIVHTHLGHGDFYGMLACACLVVQRFCTMHNIWFKWNWKDRIIFLTYRIFFGTIARNCQIVAISQCVATHVREVLRVPSSGIHIIYNAIPDFHISESRENLRRALAIPGEDFCILFVGRLHIQKSVDTLLRAFDSIPPESPPTRLIIIGEGNEADYLMGVRNKLRSRDRIEFRGVTKNPELFFAVADLFVLPSVFEGLGIVILEAFRASLPVIASRVEGPAEIIRDGRNGLLFEARNQDALRDSIVSLMEDEVRRKALGLSGYEDYRNRFSIGIYVEALESLYKKALGRDG